MPGLLHETYYEIRKACSHINNYYNVPFISGRVILSFTVYKHVNKKIIHNNSEIWHLPSLKN